LSKSYFVYTMTNRSNGVLYTGVTNDLERRIWQHRRGQGSEFVKKYNLFKLVYADTFSDVTKAIAAEKRIKKWRRAWKVQLIEDQNPAWED
jgi:putative endonuclease